LGPNGSGKSTLLSLINGTIQRLRPRSLSLWCEKGSGENIWDIKNIGYFSAMTDLFQKNDSLEQMVLSGFDSIGLYTQPSYHKK
jgi:molybdate transport system ATP-binding protein